MKANGYKTNIMPFVSYLCESFSLTLVEEHSLRFDIMHSMHYSYSHSHLPTDEHNRIANCACIELPRLICWCCLYLRRPEDGASAPEIVDFL
jgi:hypothetical protein